MKHILLKSLIISLIACCFTACDEVAEDERLIPLPPVEAARTVLLEEFTGQWCVNCPAAHSVIADLINQYPDNLIAVSIHAGGDAFSIGEGQYPGIVGLRIADGEALAAKFGIHSFPMGIVNRATSPITSDNWGSAIRAEISRPASVDIEATMQYDAANKVSKLALKISPYDNFDARLHIWVTESNISAIQMKADGTVDTEYPHNHVFRAAETAIEGTPVTLVTRQPYADNIDIPYRDNWNPDNIDVIIFLTSPDGEVLQAAKAVKSDN